MRRPQDPQIDATIGGPPIVGDSPTAQSLYGLGVRYRSAIARWCQEREREAGGGKTALQHVSFRAERGILGIPIEGQPAPRLGEQGFLA